jgi:hypothetical protein
MTEQEISEGLTYKESYELKKIFLMHYGANCIVDLSDFYSPQTHIAKKYEWTKIPGVFYGIRNDEYQWADVRFGKLRDKEGLEYNHTVIPGDMRKFSEVVKPKMIKLVLRHARSLTMLEAYELCAFENENRKNCTAHELTALTLRWMLDRGFDLYKLREKGYAVYKEDLTPELQKYFQ